MPGMRYNGRRRAGAGASGRCASARRRLCGAWRDMEKAVAMGKVRALGISNFDASDEEMVQMRSLNKEERFFNMSLKEKERAYLGKMQLPTSK